MAVSEDKYFPATVSCMVHKTSSLIKSKLTTDQMEMFRKTSFGPLLDVDLVFNGQLFHHFLLREVREDSTDSISFNILGKKVTFTQEEFNLVTGLWPTEETVDRDTCGKRLRRLILGPRDPNDKKEKLVKDVEVAFEKIRFTNDQDAVKVALALYIETVMMGKDKKTQFDMKTLGIVDDFEVFANYDWSSVFFNRLLSSMKTIMRGKKEAHDIKKADNPKHTTYYCIKGYVLAFQVRFSPIYTSIILPYLA